MGILDINTLRDTNRSAVGRIKSQLVSVFCCIYCDYKDKCLSKNCQCHVMLGHKRRPDSK